MAAWGRGTSGGRPVTGAGGAGAGGTLRQLAAAPEAIAAAVLALGAVAGLFAIPAEYAGVRDEAAFDRILGIVSRDVASFAAACVGATVVIALAASAAAWFALDSLGVRRRRVRGVLLAAGWYLFLLASCLRAPALFEDGLMRLPLFRPALVFALARAPVAGWAVWVAGLWLVPAAALVALAVAAVRRRRWLVLGAVIALVGWLAAPHARVAQERLLGADRPLRPFRRNILVVAFDSLRADHVGKVLDGRAIAPNLTELARRSLYYPATVVPIARTAPALVSLFVSRYPFKTGVSSMFPAPEHWDQSSCALPTLFRANGYDTFALGDYAAEFLTKVNLGFDRVSAPEVELPELAEQAVLLRQPVLLALAVHPLLRARIPARLDRVVTGYPQYSDPHDTLRRLVDELAESERLRRPFLGFLFVSPPHFPYASLFPHYAAHAEPGYAGPFRFKKDSGAQARDEADRRQVRALYASALGMADELLPDLLRVARHHHAGLVVTADHGELLYDGPGAGMGHGDVLRYPHAYEVPLLFHDPEGRWPVGIQPAYVRSIDVAPTLVDLLRREQQVLKANREVWATRNIPGSWDGTSVLELDLDRRRTEPFAFESMAYSETGLWMTPDAAGDGPRIPYPGITELLEPSPEHGNRLVLKPSLVPLFLHAKHRMIRSNDLKFVWKPTRDGPVVELYDVRADPEERHDLAPREPALVARFREALPKYLLGYPDGLPDAR